MLDWPVLTIWNQELLADFAQRRIGRRREKGQTFEIERFLEQPSCMTPASETGSHTQLHPNKAGLLLFGLASQDYLIQAETVGVLFGDQLGTRRYLDQPIFHANLAITTVNLIRCFHALSALTNL